MATITPPEEVRGSQALLIAIVGLILLSMAPHPTPTSYETETHYLRANPNPVSEVPEDAQVIEYESMSSTQKEIVLDTMGDRNDGLFGSYVSKYSYKSAAETKPASEISNADFVKKSGSYYAVFSKTETQTVTDSDAEIKLIRKLILGLVTLSLLASIGWFSKARWG